MLAPADTPLTWAARHSPDRIASVGVLAVHVRRYETDGAAPTLGALANLRVRAADHGEVPFWHESTGLYGFLTLPPGEARIEIDDPSGRFQAQAITAIVPDRSAIRADLEAGDPPALLPRPVYPRVALRPALAMGLRPGCSAVWGVLSDAGRPIAGALIAIDTLRRGVADTVRTLSGIDGSFLLVMPFEAIDRSVTPPLTAFDRALRVFVPRPTLATTLAAKGLLAGQPANVFSLTVPERDALFLPRDFQLRDAGGTLHPQVGGQNPLASVSVGKKVRLDIELLP